MLDTIFLNKRLIKRWKRIFINLKPSHLGSSWFHLPIERSSSSLMQLIVFDPMSLKFFSQSYLQTCWKRWSNLIWWNHLHELPSLLPSLQIFFPFSWILGREGHKINWHVGKKLFQIPLFSTFSDEIQKLCKIFLLLLKLQF